LSEHELADLIQNLPARPLGADPRGIRMSLAGAQDKLLLTRVNERWYMPVDGYPSTHIIKPTTVWPHSAENEALVLALSRECGLSDSAVWIERIGDAAALVAERFDRNVHTAASNDHHGRAERWTRSPPTSPWPPPPVAGRHRHRESTGIAARNQPPRHRPERLVMALPTLVPPTAM
jgi:hypothetical protein